jgi:phytoene synthase
MPTHSDFASDEDRAQCRAMIRAGSKSFAAASLLLPSRLREASYALYAFCRLSDDLVDVDGGSADAIARLRERLDLAYAGNPIDSSIDRAFADVVTRYAIPRALPEALVEGLEWDVAGFACEELTDVYAYAARVAGTVGAMMCVLMGVRDANMVARACDLGVAMQITNIARDVGEDARNGRLYLPRAWLRDAGLEPDVWLANPVYRPEIGSVTARLLQMADMLYIRADSGIGGLPANCRPAIFAARSLYHAIGSEVAARGFDSVSGRARVPGARKMRLITGALAEAAWPRKALAEPALAETQYLIDAVATSHVHADNVGGVADRILWVANLFVALDARDRMPGVRA